MRTNELILYKDMEDGELLQDMTFLMESIALGKEQFGLPEKEERIATHFIR